MRTREQRFADDAYKRVSDVKTAHGIGPNSQFAKEYGALAHRLPTLIRTAGLAQALAFADEKSKKASRRQLLTDLGAVLPCNSFNHLLARSREAELDEYMWLTQETLAALLWFKRYAQSVLDVEGADDGDSPPGA